MCPPLFQEKVDTAVFEAHMVPSSWGLPSNGTVNIQQETCRSFNEEAHLLDLLPYDPTVISLTETIFFFFYPPLFLPGKFRKSQKKKRRLVMKSLLPHRWAPGGTQERKPQARPQNETIHPTLVWLLRLPFLTDYQDQSAGELTVVLQSSI